MKRITPTQVRKLVQNATALLQFGYWVTKFVSLFTNYRPPRVFEIAQLQTTNSPRS